jgi:hypothetical protein
LRKGRKGWKGRNNPLAPFIKGEVFFPYFPSTHKFLVILSEAKNLLSLSRVLYTQDDIKTVSSRNIRRKK